MAVRDVEQALAALYGIAPVDVRELDGGQDARARTYAARAPDGTRYVVKSRAAGEGRDVAAAVARHLHAAGVPHVVAPLPSLRGGLAAEHAGSSFVVYPYVDARMGVDVGLSDEQWRSLGAMVRALHTTRLPAELEAALPRESYRPNELDLLPAVDEAAAAGGEVAQFWAAHRREILELVERTAELGPALAERALPLVLCHADLHTWNVLVGPNGELYVVDWDEVVLAPKERDLMFVVGGIGAGLVTADQTERFFDGYGARDVDAFALAYYRHAWAVQDVVGYAARVLVEPGLTEAQRDEAARILVGLFEPGEIVDLALG